jgi:hypothetical protein
MREKNIMTEPKRVTTDDLQAALNILHSWLKQGGEFYKEGGELLSGETMSLINDIARLAEDLGTKFVRGSKYRIPEKMARTLWEFAEGELVDELHQSVGLWAADKISDKRFLGTMRPSLEQLRQFQRSILSKDLAAALYDGRTHDRGSVEWMEEPDDCPF